MKLKDNTSGKQDISLNAGNATDDAPKVKVKALKTMFGNAGYVAEGEVFETSEHHAKALIKAGHAEEAKASAEAVPFKHIDTLHELPEKVELPDTKEKKKLSDNPGAKK